jgi:hypothetical protein
MMKVRIEEMASAAKNAELAKRGLHITPTGQVSFPHLFGAPKDYNNNGKYTWNVHLVFHDATVLEDLKAFVKNFVKVEGTKGKTKTFDKEGKLVPNFRWPWRSNSEKVYTEGDRAGEVREGFESDGEHIVFKRHAKAVEFDDDGKPKKFSGGNFDKLDISGRPLQIDDVYAGCVGVVCFRPYVYRKGSNVGVSLSLEAFQKADDGESIGGGGKVDAASVFDFVEPGDEISIDDI